MTGLARRGLLALRTAEVERRPLAGRAEPRRGALPGRGCADRRAGGHRGRAVTAAMAARRGTGFLLEGPTASGKTAVYVAAIAAALGRRAGRARAGAGDRARGAHRRPAAPRPGHGAGAAAQRAGGRGARRRVASGPGVASAPGRGRARASRSWRPSPIPGVIVVDEEHDAAYKSDRTPRIQARDVALELGRLAGAPVILGSATPDIVSVGSRARGRAGARPPHRARRRRGCAGGGGGPAGGAGGGQPRPALRAAGGGAPGARPRRRETGRSWSSTAAAARRWCCAGTAATSRSAPIASDRSSSMPARWRCAATTAAPRPPSRVAARPAARRASATWAAARSGSSARCGVRLPDAAGRPPRPRRGRAAGRGRADRGRLHRGSAGRAGGHEPRDQGARRAGGHARGRRLGGHRPDPAR